MTLPCSPSSAPPPTPRSSTGMVDRAAEHRWGWQYWAYCGCDDPTTTGPGAEQALVFDPAKSPTGDNIDHAKLAALVTPHPLVVSGTPSNWAFDRETRRFVMSWSTARTGSLPGRFGAGSISRISLPTWSTATGTGSLSPVVRSSLLPTRLSSSSGSPRRRHRPDARDRLRRLGRHRQQGVRDHGPALLSEGVSAMIGAASSGTSLQFIDQRRRRGHHPVLAGQHVARLHHVGRQRPVLPYRSVGHAAG